MKKPILSTKHVSSPHTVPPVLQILNGTHKGKQFRLLSSQISFGRHKNCDVIFKDDSNCSMYHARIIRQGNVYTIESLDRKNPVLINEKPVVRHTLQQKDTVSIGNINLLFLVTSNLPYLPARGHSLQARRQSIPSSRQRKVKKKKTWLTPPRLVFIILILGVFFLVTSEDDTKEKKALKLKTEMEILEDVEELKTFYDEQKEKKTLNTQQYAAKVAFIKGFRDYRKGFFHRALKTFRHCLTLYKDHKLCQSYVQKSNVQIERLIQIKIRLGNTYKANKQYEACHAAFKSVEVMIKDFKSPVYKEVHENKKLCALELENKL